MLTRIYLLLLRVFGNALNLITGDTLVFDRWLWLKRNLPRTNNGERALDIGCGSGAFTLASVLRGYKTTGLSWDLENQKKAQDRAAALNVDDRCGFPVFDARELHDFPADDGFDYILNFENIEHILDDRTLLVNIERHLNPGGYLLLSAPNLNFIPMSIGDIGPFPTVEDGSHMRRGYSPQMLIELCDAANLRVEKIDYCSGFASQLTTRFLRLCSNLIGYKLSWIIVLPLRLISAIFEALGFRGRGYSICLVAYKPRFSGENTDKKNL